MKSYLIPNWPAPKNIRAYTTTRFGGFSEPPYENFNLATHVDDDPKVVQKNRAELKKILEFPAEPRWLNQTHSTITLNASACEIPQEADASFTRNPREICVVLTADCLPLLFCNEQGTEVGAIHAGWQGLCKGIIDSAMQAVQSPHSELLVWLGPAISKDHLQLNEEVYQQYIMRDPKFAAAFSKKNGEWFLDMYHAAKINLAKYGVTKIFGGDHCTYREKDLFFSYRRDARITGRMASLIWIQDLAKS